MLHYLQWAALHRKYHKFKRFPGHCDLCSISCPTVLAVSGHVLIFQLPDKIHRNKYRNANTHPKKENEC